MAEPALKQDNDPSSAPPSANPFDQIDPGGQGGQAAPSANPFDDVGPKLADNSSTFGAFRRGIERSAVPAIGSFPAIGAGAEAGAAVGAAVGGPLAPITAPVGGLIGGIAGAYLGSTALSSVQNWALSKMPDSWREAIGMDDRQEKLDEGQHPIASFLGGLTPYAMTMRPGALGMKGPQLAENATAMQRIMANPVTARVFGGAAMGGMELGNEAGSGESPDWTKVAIATGFGLVFNKPTTLGESLTEIGAKPARGILGRPEPTAAAPPAAEPTEAPAAEPLAPAVRPAGITQREWNETLLGQKPPTVAQAADVNVAGPGITESTFLGGEERSPEAALTAHDTARAEDSVIGEPKVPDVNDIARRIEPETFERYDELTSRANEFRRWIDEFNTPPPEAFQDLEQQRAALQSQHDEHVASQGGYTGSKDARRLRAQIRDVESQRQMLADRAAQYGAGEAEETPDLAMARKHLMDTEYELRDLAPQVRAAYGRAADAIGAGTVPPEPVEPAEAAPAAPAPAAGPQAPPLIPDQAPPAAAAGPVVKPIADQKAFIAQDVARQMVAAGRPADEAQAAGTLVAARYEARAARLKGAIGTAEELYRTESAEIRGPGGKRAPPAPAAPENKLAEEFKPGAAPKAPEEPIPESEITTTEVKPKTARGARARDPSTWSLMEFLVDRGGISPDERNISDLRSIFGKKNKFVPGFGQMIRPGGMSLDRALEAATEAGYFHDQGAVEGTVSQTSISQLLEALGEENRGNRLYRPGNEPAPEAEDPAERHYHIERALDQALTEDAIPPASVTGKLRDRVIEIMDKEGVSDPIVAWERAVMEQDENAARAGEIEPRTESLPGWDVPDDAGAARGAGPAAQAEQVAQREGAGPAAPVAGEGTAQARELAQEPGAEGKPQGLIPGVEPVTDAQRAQLEANRPLQGGAEPAGGMFDEDARNQKEFWQRDPAAPFYSAVDRAVENVKLEKGSPEQWLGTIRNATGVKAEEMEWLGIADWLKEQKGPVTKQQVQDYIRANQIQVQEVEHGLDRDNVKPDEQASGEHLPAWNELVGKARTLRQQIEETWTGKREVQDRPALHLDLTRTERVMDDLHKRMIDETIERMGGEQPKTKFGSYIKNKGENYREMVLTLPKKDTPTTDPYEARRRAVEGDTADFVSPHWEEPNPVANILYSDRTIGDKKYLQIHEEQSDWHQKGRAQGYKGAAIESRIAKERADLIAERQKMIGDRDVATARDSMTPQELAREQQIINRLEDIDTREVHGVPDAPFKTSWHELATKRMVRYAAEHGYDGVLVDSGETVAGRYDLSKQIKKITLEPHQLNGEKIGYKLEAYDHNNRKVIEEYPKTPERISEIIGKEPADKLFSDENKERMDRGLGNSLSGLDLKIGGEFHKKLYDEKIPQALNKIGKKFGAKVEEGREPAAQGAAKSDQAPIQKFDITDELRDAATGEGFPLFQGARGKINLLEGRKPIITLMKDANASTFIHETGHQFLEEILRDAQHPAAPADLKADAATVRKWVGASPDGNLKTAHHEKFARGFEQYLREGTAPSEELASVFAKFKNWLLQIYQTIKGLGKPINEDIRSVFDRMLVEEPKRTVLAPERAAGPTLADIHEVDAQHTEPAEAEPAMDRVLGEAARAEAELPPQVQHEIETKVAAAEAARAESAAEPAGQGGASAVQPAEVVPASGGPEPKPAGGTGGEEPGEVVRGGPEAGGQGASVSGPERGSDGGTGPDANPLAPTPARTLEPREPKLVDKAGNIRIENLTSVSDIAQAIRESAERNADFQAVRGQATMGEMMNLADSISIDPAKIDEGQLANLFGGYENMAPKIWALRKALVDSAQIVSNAMKLVREDASDGNAAAMAMAMTRHDMLQSTLSKATAESGRTLGMAFKNLEGWENAQDLDQFMKANTGRTLFQLKMIAKLGAQLDTPAKVSKFLRDAQKRSFPGMILEYWINGLISGIATHTTYMMGNTGLAAIRAVPETMVAAALGRLREVGGEEGAHVQLGEVGARLGAAVRGLPAAIEATIEAARSGVTTLLPGETSRPSMPFSGENQIVVGKNATNEPVTWGDVKNQVSGIMRGLRDGIVANAALLSAGGEPGAPMIGTMYSPLGQIPDIGIRGVNVLPVGTIARIPSRGIAAIHSFFRSVNFSMEKAADAYRTAAAEGLQGEAFDRRAGQIWSDPTEEQMAKYRFQSTEATLMGQGGAFTQKLSQLMNVEVGGWRPLKFIDPFVHISSNIIKQTIVERTPVGLLSPEIRADLMGRQIIGRDGKPTGQIDVAARDMAQARMLVGTALSVTFAGLASQGVISGSGPKDRNEAAMWRLAGNQAHSVRIGDTWWDMHRLGPLGMLLGISADMYEVAHKVSNGEYLDAAQHLQHAVTQNVLDESFMRGPASLIQAVEDPDRYGQAYIKNTLASFIPFSVGLSQQARAMDPYTRQARTVVDAIRQKIPGHLDKLFGAELFPRLDIWGEPMPNPDALIKAGLTAIYAKQMSNDPVNKAMIELGIGPAPVTRKIRNVDLDDKQYDDFARLSGRMTKQRLNVIVQSADWNSWTPYIRGTIVQEVIKQSREAARGVMMMRYPQIVRDATQAKKDDFTDEPDPIR